MTSYDQDSQYMRRALELSIQGQGYVEPNPMVGCVIVADDRIVGEGWHGRFGGPHAEIEALKAAGTAARDATMYVTLEPCCHHGKTPPCSEAVLQAGLRRVVIAHRDPFPLVAGGGIGQLEAAGVNVEVGVLELESLRMNAPYLKLVRTGQPWVIAKWAMTLDGKIAAHTGDSRWISGTASRERVHQLRARMDAIIVGSGTAAADDPELTVRPPGARTPTRIVVDSQATLSNEGRLAKTARETPVLIAVGPDASSSRCDSLHAAGCEVWVGQSEDRTARLAELLVELGRRKMTNVLIEGGSRLLGNLFDAKAIDEVHAFIAGKLIGGATARSPIAGIGLDRMGSAVCLEDQQIELLDGDVYVRGRLNNA